MPQPLTERVLIPDATRSRLLVATGDPPTLPGWRLADDDPAEGIRVARRTLGIASPFLRPVRHEGDGTGGGEVETLLEFDAARADWEPAPPLGWLPFAAVTGTGLDAGPFGADVVAWTAELRSGEIPARRSDWARPGWLAATEAWLTAQLAGLGRVVTGPVEQLGSWPISSLLGVETTAGRIVVKTVPPAFAHELVLTQALAVAHPGLVPRVLAIDRVGRHLVMEAFGGEALGQEDAGGWGAGLAQMAVIQQAWIGRRGEVLALGVPDRSLPVLDAEIEAIVTDEDASPALDPATRARLVANLPRYHDLIGRLGSVPLPATLIHGDLHPWNVHRDDDRLVIYDWSDACWGHPLLDIATFTNRTEDRRARESMRTAYLGAWADHTDPASLRQAMAWAAPVTELHLAITWHRLQSVVEPDPGSDLVSSGVRRHLEAALAATDELP